MYMSVFTIPSSEKIMIRFHKFNTVYVSARFLHRHSLCLIFFQLIMLTRSYLTSRLTLCKLLDASFFCFLLFQSLVTAYKHKLLLCLKQIFYNPKSKMYTGIPHNITGLDTQNSSVHLGFGIN